MQNNPRSEKRARFLARSRETVMEALRSRDMLLGGVTKSIEDIDKTINLLCERLEAWYGIYFPELKLEDKPKYCEAVLSIDRENLDAKALEGLFGQKRADEITASANTSLGAKLSPEDLAQMRALAQAVLALDKQRKDFEAYQKALAQELCPNMSAVAGPDVAARLVSHVGSLRKLALLPSSTIQVLGAEKALFKHLKNRKVPPPKHGIIFLNVKISSSPKAVRGKIARVLANKLTLAAKADSFTKKDMRADLRKGLEERLNEIMAQYERQKLKPETKPAPPTQASQRPPAPKFQPRRR